MKKILILGFATLLFGNTFAQLALPTNNSFAVTTPVTGWTENLALPPTAANPRYATGSDATPACRFDVTGENLFAFLAESPGVVTYFIRGQVGNGVTSFDGTFKLQESVDGNSYTDVVTHGTGSIPVSPNSFLQVTATLAGPSRYVRWIFTNKVSGYNVAVDNINIAPAASGTVEIAVSQGVNNIANNFTLNVGNVVSGFNTTGLDIQNTGTNLALTLGAPTVTGADASMFTINSFPTSVAAGGGATFNVVFTPTGAQGSKNAVLTFSNNDADENPYTINLLGVFGNLASEPSAPTAFNVTNLKTYTMNVSWTAPAQAPTGYLVVRNTGGPSTDAPMDGNVYQKGQTIGTSKVLFIGTATNFTPRELQAATDYGYAVYAYNGSGSTINYTSVPLSSVVTTPANMIGSYYAALNPNATTFLTDLTRRISVPYTQIFYGNYTSTLINNFYARDTTNGQEVITCAYSGRNASYTPPFSYTGIDFSREHTFPASWMLSYGVTQDSVPYSDLHNLFPTDLTNANQPRSNYPFGDIVGNPTYTYLECNLGNGAQGGLVFSPRAAQRGDAARAMMYMVIKWNRFGNFNWRILGTQNQALLKSWNVQDPPSRYEMARNDYIQSVQQNRNPFIDNPTWVDLFDFFAPQYVSVDEPNIGLLLMYPNPADANTIVELPNMEGATMKVYDIAGRLVHTQTIMETITQLSTSAFNNGMYIVRVENEKAIYQAKLNVQR